MRGYLIFPIMFYFYITPMFQQHYFEMSNTERQCVIMFDVINELILA